MQSIGEPLLYTRRSVLLLAGAGLAWAGTDFWNKKEPGQWTPEEIDKLLTKSPWAKEVSASAPRQNANSNPGGSPGPGGGYPPNIGMPRIGGMGYPRGGRRGGGNPGGGMTTRKGTVLWESARPVLEATKHKLPESFPHHYVIGVSGFPAGSGDSIVDELKQATIIQPKGKELCQASAVEKYGSRSDWLFGFSKDAIQISLDDKEIEFQSRIGRFLVKTKFTLKEMVYKGELAV